MNLKFHRGESLGAMSVRSLPVNHPQLNLASFYTMSKLRNHQNLKHLPVSTRTRNQLLRRGFRTVDELLRLRAVPDEVILSWPKFGSYTLRELRAAIAQLDKKVCSEVG